ncbi:NtaA/DmoA family FMN-dependent monooxygenase [Streptomyces sp. CA-100214]
MINHDAPPLGFAHFTCFAPAGPPNGTWTHPKARDFDYMNLDHWIKLAQALEEAGFDFLFWADMSGVHDLYKGSYATCVREAAQFPLGDPLILTAALAASTKNLGFAFSANPIQDHPYAFARKLSTLDHLTRGRVAWNVVTSFQASAWRNLGHDELGKHTARYERAEEFITVLYKLLEGSWEDNAVLRDVENRIYADPAKVHPINHEGELYRVPGIHTNEPSPQRTPVIFQAGTSTDGRAFAARNAEAMFIAPKNIRGGKALIDDMTQRAVANGRSPSDLTFWKHINVIIGSTEAEATAKAAEADEYLSEEGTLAFQSSGRGLDLSQLDLDSTVAQYQTEAIQGEFAAMADAIPNKEWTWREALMGLNKTRFVGTPDQLADHLEEWREIGVTGINITYVTGPEEAYTFCEHATPVLKKRGLMRTESHPGTLREKIFANTGSPSGPRLNERHPAARYRRS